MGILDEYGDPAQPRDLDPTHLRAVAERIKTLASAMEAMRSEGHDRDRVLAEIRSDVDNILRLGGRFTEEQIKVLEDIIIGRTWNRGLMVRLKLVASYAVGIIIAIWGILNVPPLAVSLFRRLFP